MFEHLKDTKVWLGNLMAESIDTLAEDIITCMNDNKIGQGIYSDPYKSGITTCIYFTEKEWYWGISQRNYHFSQSKRREIKVEEIFPFLTGLAGCQIYTRDAEHFRKIQKAIFARDKSYHWVSSGRIFIDYSTKYPWLDVSSNGEIIRSVSSSNTKQTIYLSQIQNHHYNGEQVKVQRAHQPEPGCTGSSAGRLQSRHCKITTGRRYTGYPVSHLRSRPKVRPSTVSGSICKPGYSDSSYGTQGPQRGTGRAAEAERGAVLDPLDTIKRKYQPYKS